MGEWESLTDNGTSEEGMTISELGRELLKYLFGRIQELGTNQASYRQARMELLRILESNRQKTRFNWGFEAVFTQEIHVLEEFGLVAVKYGSSSIMVGRNSPNAIYNVSLTGDGMDTARVIVERENRARAETAKVANEREFEQPDDTELDPNDETDLDNAEDNAPPSLPGDKYSHHG